MSIMFTNWRVQLNEWVYAMKKKIFNIRCKTSKMLVFILDTNYTFFWLKPWFLWKKVPTIKSSCLYVWWNRTERHATYLQCSCLEATERNFKPVMCIVWLCGCEKSMALFCCVKATVGMNVLQDHLCDGVTKVSHQGAHSSA